MSKPTDKFWKEFSAALMQKDEVRPSGEGWISSEKIYAELGRGKGKKLLTKNKEMFEHFWGRILRNGRLVNASWYRLKKPCKK